MLANRTVALKVLGHELQERPDAESRFAREAQSAAALTHPGIVPILRHGSARGISYIASELVEGPTLGEWIAGRADAARTETADQSLARYRECAEIAASVAEALDHAHRAGIIHRDVKPANILMDHERRPRIADFGIALDLFAPGLTRTHEVQGTVHYMSPEHARILSARVDARSDVFSLGVVLYEMLAMRRPFDGETQPKVLSAIAQCEPAMLRRVDPRIPKHLQTICHKALEKHPAQRYQSAGQMAADLRAWLGGRSPVAVPPGIGRRTRKFVVRHRLPMLIAFAVSVSAAALVMRASLRARHEATLSWAEMQSDVGPCTVIVQAVDRATLQLGPPTESLDVADLLRRGFAPAQYRMTFVPKTPGASDQFAEVDVLLIALGPERATKVRVALGEASMPPDGAVPARLTRISPTPPEDMARIQAGSYECGSGQGDTPEMRRVTIELASFDLDKHEVSNAEYLRFLYETASSDAMRNRLDRLVAGIDLDPSFALPLREHHPHTPDFWRVYGYDAALADRPVVGVRPSDAHAYARWHGKRLPTMFEWDAAATHTNGRPDDPLMEFPQGFSESAGQAFSPTRETLASAQARDVVTPLNTYRSLSRSVNAPDPWANNTGLQWLYGNAAEIVSTVDVDGLGGVIKGRSWLDVPAHWPLAMSGTIPHNSPYVNRGFRCARSVTPVPIIQK